MTHFRIISLAPTHTETLCFLGVEDRVIGVTENCDYPESVKVKPTFGSWAYPDVPKILEAEPDLVCTFGDHQLEVAEMLREHGISVFHSNPPDVDSAIGDIEKLGETVGVPAEGQGMKELRLRIRRVREKTLRVSKRPKVLRIMNWNPLVTVGPGAFQDDVIKVAGGINIFGDVDKPYFTVSLEEVKNRNPEVVFFCEEELKNKILNNAMWQSVTAVKNMNIYCFPCGLTCRSGPRIVDMVEELARVLHPEVFRARGTQANC